MTKHRLLRGKGTPHRHRFPRPALVVAGVLAVAALLWMLVAVPALVKYPTDLDVDLQYKGTFTVLVNPTTAAPLAEPMVVPLTVDRHLEAVGDESGASVVVIRETIRQQAGDLFDVTQTNQYVMDRSTVENVADDRAFAFEPANVVDRSGAYRLNLPFDTSTDETYAIYTNEIAGTYETAADTETTTGRGRGPRRLLLRRQRGRGPDVCCLPGRVEQGRAVAHVADPRADEASAAGGWHRRRRRAGRAHPGAHP